MRSKQKIRKSRGTSVKLPADWSDIYEDAASREPVPLGPEGRANAHDRPEDP